MVQNVVRLNDYRTVRHAEREVEGYRIWDCKDRAWVSSLYGPTQRKRAHTRANKLDQKYGAIRYSVKTFYV